MDSKSMYGRHQMLRPPGELPSFERNKIGEQKIIFFYLLWVNEKLKHKRLVKT